MLCQRAISCLMKVDLRVAQFDVFSQFSRFFHPCSRCHSHQQMQFDVNGVSKCTEESPIKESSLSPTKSYSPSRQVTHTRIKKDFTDLIVQEPETKIAFWETPKGLVLKDKIFTGVGRVMRLFVSIEKYDDIWEWGVVHNIKRRRRYNKFDEIIIKSHGPEVGVGMLIMQLGGAFKFVTDDRWIDDVRKIRTPKRKDFTIEAIDVRGSALSYEGLKYFENAGFVKYLNVGDCKDFDNLCMSRLHPLADTLEYLDVSGTNITAQGLSYLRMFPRLKWLNLSRVDPSVKQVLPYLLEILPLDCVVVTDDDTPALNYGSDIPFRHLFDPTQDLALENDPGIGNVTVFNEKYGSGALNCYDPTHVHQLWKTPIVSEGRKKTMQNKQPSTKKRLTLKMVEYIKKAEKYPPLL